MSWRKGRHRVGERHNTEYGPGIEMSPMTLIWFTVGVRATLSASVVIGLHASNREAPSARYVSTLSLLSLHINDGVYASTRELMGRVNRSHIERRGCIGFWGNGTVLRGTSG